MAQPPATSPEILGQYALRKKLGSGAMGQVWLAHDQLLERDVAIKLLHAGTTNPRLVKDFFREAQSAAKLNHPNTVTIHQIGRHGDQVYIAMEYVEAGSLADELRDKGALPWREATQAIRDAAAGLQAAHDLGMVHRDVKPSNLMRSARGMVKVVDFGLAKARDGNTDMTQTQPGTILGSPAYMSPEQCRGQTADARSDLYSLICSYYQLLTRQLPFAASEATAAMYQHCHEPFPDPRGKIARVPDGVCRILDKGSRKDPAARYQTAEELIADLDAVLHTPEVSHTFNRGAQKPAASRGVGAVSVGSILRGKGVMGKTTWALIVAALTWLMAVSLLRRSPGPIAFAPGANAVPGAPDTRPAAVPSPAAQAKAERTIKDVFRTDYARTDAADRTALAEKLLDQGRETNNDLAAKFVLFREARDLAAGAGNFDLALRAVDQLSSAFAVDAAELKATALSAAAPRVESPEQNEALVRACLDVLGSAVATEQYPVATHLLAVADAAARKSQQIPLLADVHARAAEVQERREDLERRKAAAAALAHKPGDPEANAAMGKSLCFFKGAWGTGLPMLAKGSDAPLKDLATRELAAPADAATRLKLADGWWDLAQKQTEPAQAEVRRHAAVWYEKAWPGLAGLDRSKAESRIPAEARVGLVAVANPGSEPPARPASPAGSTPPLAPAIASVDVLKLIDPQKHALEGDWLMKDGVLTSSKWHSVIQVPYKPSAEYNFRVVFSPIGSDHGLNLVLPKGERSFVFTIGSTNYWDGFNEVKGKRLDGDNPAAVKTAVRPVAGRKYTVEVRVRNDGVQGFLDNKLVVGYKTDYSEMAVAAYFIGVPKGTLGLAAWDTPAIIYSAEVVEIKAPPAAGMTAPALSVRTDADGHRVVDLLPLIDVDRGTEKWDARWTRIGAELTSKASLTYSLLAIPYDPPPEYDLAVEFTPPTGTGARHVLGEVLSHGGHQFCWLLAQYDADTLSVLTLANSDLNDKSNKSRTVRPGGLSIQKHSSLVRVRNGSVSTYLDGQLLTQFVTDYTDLEPQYEWRIFGSGLGLGTWHSDDVTYHKVEIVEVSGQGRYIPPPPQDPRLLRSYPAAKSDHSRDLAVRITPDNRHVLRTGDGATIWDWASAARVLDLPDSHVYALSADSRYLAIARGQAAVVLETEHPDRAMTLPGAKLYCAALSPDDSRLANVSDGGPLCVWDRASGAMLTKAALKERLSGMLAFSPDGARLFHTQVTEDCGAMWDARNGTRLWTIGPSVIGAGTGSFSRDGKRIAVGSWSDSCVFDSSNGKLISRCRGHGGDGLPIYSPTGSLVLCSWRGGPLSLYDAETGEDLNRFKDLLPDVISASWSPDGRRVLAGCKDGFMRLLDVETGKELAAFGGHTGPVRAVAFSPDGKFVVSACNDNKVRVFRVP